MRLRADNRLYPMWCSPRSIEPTITYLSLVPVMGWKNLISRSIRLKIGPSRPNFPAIRRVGDLQCARGLGLSVRRERISTASITSRSISTRAGQIGSAALSRNLYNGIISRQPAPTSTPYRTTFSGTPPCTAGTSPQVRPTACQGGVAFVYQVPRLSFQHVLHL